MTAAWAQAPSVAQPAGTGTGAASGSREEAATTPGAAAMEAAVTQATVEGGWVTAAVVAEAVAVAAEAVGGSATTAEGSETLLRPVPVSRRAWMPAGPACRPPTARRRTGRAACTAGRPARNCRRSAGWLGTVAASTMSNQSDPCDPPQSAHDGYADRLDLILLLYHRPHLPQAPSVRGKQSL